MSCFLFLGHLLASIRSHDVNLVVNNICKCWGQSPSKRTEHCAIRTETLNNVIWTFREVQTKFSCKGYQVVFWNFKLVRCMAKHLRQEGDVALLWKSNPYLMKYSICHSLRNSYKSAASWDEHLGAFIKSTKKMMHSFNCANWTESPLLCPPGWSFSVWLPVSPFRYRRKLAGF